MGWKWLELAGIDLNGMEQAKIKWNGPITVLTVSCNKVMWERQCSKKKYGQYLVAAKKVKMWYPKVESYATCGDVVASLGTSQDSTNCTMIQ